MAIPEIDLTNLDEKEVRTISRVLQRDRTLRIIEENRLLPLKMELQSLRRRGALRQGLDTSRCCARCTSELGRLINRGALCAVCRKKVCKACRQYGDVDKQWVCVVCRKQMEFKAASGEWMQEFCRRSSKRRVRRAPAGDLLLRAILEARQKGSINRDRHRVRNAVNLKSADLEEAKVGEPVRDQEADGKKQSELPFTIDIRKQFKKLELLPLDGRLFGNLKRSESQPALDEKTRFLPVNEITSHWKGADSNLVQEIRRRFGHNEPESEPVELIPESARLKKISRSVETLAEISRNYHSEEMEKTNLIRKLSKPESGSSSSSVSPDGARKASRRRNSPHARSCSASSEVEERWCGSPTASSTTKRSPTLKEKSGGDTDSAYSTSPRATHLKPVDVRPASGSTSSISESEVEKSTGVIFRKVTLKKRKSNEEERERAHSALDSPYYTGCAINHSTPINERIPLTIPFPGEGYVFLTFSHTDTQLEGTEDLERYRLNLDYYRIVYIEDEDEETESPKTLRVTSRFQMYGSTLCIEDSDWELCSDCDNEFSHYEKRNCQITAINLSKNHLEASLLFNGAAANRFHSRIESYSSKENGSNSALSLTNAREMKGIELIRPDQEIRVAASEGSSPSNVLNSDENRAIIEQSRQLLAGNLNQTTCNVGSILPSDEANVNNDEEMTKNEEALPFVVSHGLDQANSVSVACRGENDVVMCEQSPVESSTREVDRLNSGEACYELQKRLNATWETAAVMEVVKHSRKTCGSWEDSKQDLEIQSGGEELDKPESDTDSQDTVIESESYGRMRSLALREKILQANEELMKMDNYQDEDSKFKMEDVTEETWSFPLGCESTSREKENVNDGVMNSMHELISCVKAENCEKSWHFSNDDFRIVEADNLEVDRFNDEFCGVSDSLASEPKLPYENKEQVIISTTITEVEQSLDQHAVESLQGNNEQEINAAFCTKSSESNSEEDVFLTDSSSDEFTYSSYAYSNYDCHPLPHILHTITEESCEESEKCSPHIVTTSNLKRLKDDNLEDPKLLLTARKGEQDLDGIDTNSETSESTYNENNNNNNNNNRSRENLKTMAISRLEKYFSSGLSEAGHFCYPDDSELTDESGGVSSDDETSINKRTRTDSVSSIGTELSEGEFCNQNLLQNPTEMPYKETLSDNEVTEKNKLDKALNNPPNKLTCLPEQKKLIIEKETNQINKTELPVNFLSTGNHFNYEKEEILNDVQTLFKELFENETNQVTNSLITDYKYQKNVNRNLSSSMLNKSYETNLDDEKYKSDVMNRSNNCVAKFNSTKLIGNLSENDSLNCNNNGLDNWKLLELQIAKLMQTVSPLSLSAEEPSSSSCSSTIGSNNSDYGSDTLESEEELTDAENNLSGYKNSLLHSEFDSNKTALQNNLMGLTEFNNESTISEETLYICKQLMASLKKITSESIFDSSGNSQTQESDMIHARQYIKNQIIALMHTVSVSRNNSPLRERRERQLLKNVEMLNNPSDTQDSSDVECSKPVERKSSIKSKTPSESGSETTVSASISIPSFDDSDNTPTESEISHEMDELFALLESSNGNLPESLVMKSHINSEISTIEEDISFSSSDTLVNSRNKSMALTEQLILERDHTNSEKCNNFLLYLDSNYDPNEYSKNQVPIWRDNMCNSLKSQENKHQNIEVTFISSANANSDTSEQDNKFDYLSKTEETNKIRSSNMDSCSNIFTANISRQSSSNYTFIPEKSSSIQISVPTDRVESVESIDALEENSDASYDISRQSFESVREMPMSETHEIKQCTRISVSLNSKEKACSENDLLSVNYRIAKKNAKVLATKSTGNISELETGSNKSAFRDTGYYSFKSSEESILSLDDLPNSPTSSTSLTFYRSLTSTEAIPEVDEESSTSKSMPSMSLSSGNIPREVCSSSSSKSSTLPLSIRAKLYMPPATRPRPFTSSFFSTSGVLRKLTALRDESSLSHRPSPHGRLRARGRSSSGGSDDCKQENVNLPQISVCDYAKNTSRQNNGASSDKDSIGIQDDDVDQVFSYHSKSQLSLSSFVARSESMTSVYSAAGGGRYGTVVVSGEVLFGLNYNYKASCLEVHVKECRNIAAVDTKKNRSDPYTKVYLLPDRTKSGKRKTKVKKHTLNPNFDEVLKFPMTISELETRTLWLSIWHSDMFGRNDFLGEVMLPLGYEVFDNPGLRWYPLQERLESLDSPISYKGDLNLALKYVPFDVTTQKPSKRSGRPAKGSLHVLVKEARNLMAVRSNGTSDPFCKSYLLPDKSKSGKQKTHVIKKTCNPKWNHTFVYDDVSIEDLHDRCLELTIWDYDKITSNDFLGGVRLNLGTGKYEGRDVEWMDSQGEEIIVWRSVLEKPNMWIDCSLLLRSSMQSRRTL
ncbi:uncharacterized protein LOC111617926 [Centruroides sculpturatus]|uniref:uncharacterized protein LOC111617926 n=1 Tax=Centruroides sculpturatus TaxID=218467 RepID=UPI000C6DD6DB|nr:uncharacterized protein LOC111617926 [Centruroides sculpturatus]XP_023215062.1 uncharacterized protein LOC111617926 [Centruroides sculpturatus]XP_023215063.1 uncharacterized protein LOC111617926 [Centruroides sculpturatus]